MTDLAMGTKESSMIISPQRVLSWIVNLCPPSRLLILKFFSKVYHGPVGEVLAFFETQGFKCPERKGAADFLQEVTSLKDQQVGPRRPVEICV